MCHAYVRLLRRLSTKSIQFYSIHANQNLRTLVPLALNNSILFSSAEDKTTIIYIYIHKICQRQTSIKPDWRSALTETDFHLLPNWRGMRSIAVTVDTIWNSIRHENPLGSKLKGKLPVRSYGNGILFFWIWRVFISAVQEAELFDIKGLQLRAPWTPHHAWYHISLLL